jgi:hypothetical protein
MTTTLRSHVWNGTPIEYVERPIPVDDRTTFILCSDYLDRESFPRYVAIQKGEIVAVAVGANFCNMVVDPLFRGSLALFPPSYEHRPTGTVYVVPVVSGSGPRS